MGCGRILVESLEMSAEDKPTKLLVVLYYYYPYVSGVTVYAQWIAEGLAKKRYDVTVLTSQHEKGLPKEEVVNGVRIVRRPVLLRLGKGVIMPTFWLDMIRYARESDYVNIHLPMAESGVAALFMPKKKIITIYHCDLYLGPGLLDRLITAVSFASMRLQLRRSRLIVTNTRDYFEHSKMKRYLSKVMPVYPPVPKPNPTDDSQKLFATLGVAADEVKIGFVGRIVYEKGLQYLLEAIPYLQKEIPRFKIVLLGDYTKVAGGSIKDQLDKYLYRYPDHILFTGYLDDADRDRFYAGLDVFVLPSIDPLESFGIVQVEAMLGGAPVVASDLPGVREVVSKTGYGRISKLKDPEDIANQIIEVVKNPNKYKPEPSKIAEYFDPEESIEAYAKAMPKI